MSYKVTRIRESHGIVYDVEAPCGCVWTIPQGAGLEFGILTLCEGQECVFQWTEAAEALTAAPEVV
jgi:hypothetical protein